MTARDKRTILAMLGIPALCILWFVSLPMVYAVAFPLAAQAWLWWERRE